jgi:hypothetical protein
VAFMPDPPPMPVAPCAMADVSVLVGGCPRVFVCVRARVECVSVISMLGHLNCVC